MGIAHVILWWYIFKTKVLLYGKYFSYTPPILCVLFLCCMHFVCPISGAANVLDGHLGYTFRDWYPDFRTKLKVRIKQAA